MTDLRLGDIGVEDLCLVLAGIMAGAMLKLRDLEVEIHDAGSGPLASFEVRSVISGARVVVHVEEAI